MKGERSLTFTDECLVEFLREGNEALFRSKRACLTHAGIVA